MADKNERSSVFETPASRIVDMGYDGLLSEEAAGDALKIMFEEPRVSFISVIKRWMGDDAKRH